MRIQGLPGGIASALGFGTPTESSDALDATARAARATANPAAHPSSSSFHEILSRYDVRDISPREFSELIQQLYDAHEISSAELTDLSKIRLQLDQSQASPDDRVDLIALLEQQLQAAEKTRDQASNNASTDASAVLGPLRQQLAWLQKFDLVHNSAHPDALNLIA